MEIKLNYSELIEEVIKTAIANYDDSYLCPLNPFEEILSMGELIDRLSVINFKLYKLQDEVVDRPQDNEFKAWSAAENVRLVKERARLKAGIDEKLLSMIHKYNEGDKTGGFNKEVKKYGK